MRLTWTAMEWWLHRQVLQPARAFWFSQSSSSTLRSGHKTQQKMENQKKNQLKMKMSFVDEARCCLPASIVDKVVFEHFRKTRKKKSYKLVPVKWDRQTLWIFNLCKIITQFGQKMTRAIMLLNYRYSYNSTWRCLKVIAPVSNINYLQLKHKYFRFSLH